MDINDIGMKAFAPAYLVRKVNGFGKKVYDLKDCEYIVNQLNKIMGGYEIDWYKPNVEAMMIKNTLDVSVNLIAFQHYIEMYRVYRNLIRMLTCDADTIPRKIDVMTALCQFSNKVDVFEEVIKEND